MPKSELFNIYVPSYGRADTTRTFQLLEYCTYVVRESEEDEYRARGIESIISVPDAEIDNLCKVSNWIVDNAPEQIVCTVDDDIKYFLYRMEKNVKIHDVETATAELERIGQIMYDLGIGFGSEDASIAPWNYNAEFAWHGTTGAVRWYNKKVYKSRFDEEVYHNCDLDVELHELLVNRITLQPRYYCSQAGTDVNAGGNSSKTRRDQEDSIKKMMIRWGKHFSYNLKNNKPRINVER